MKAAASSRSGPRLTSGRSPARAPQTYDAKGMTIVPGFIDCHNHAARHDAALRGARRQSVRGGVRHRSRASSRSSARRPRRRRRAPGSRATSSTTRRSRTSARSTSTTSTRCRRIIRSSCTIAAATRRSTTARRSRWRASRKDTPNPPGGTFDRDANGELNGRVTDRARNVFDKRGHASDVHRRADGRSATATAWRTSRSSSSATA